MKEASKSSNTGFLFVFFFLCAIYGFYASYFGQFPVFNPRITTLTHLHGISITIWMLTLIAQPVLIRYKRYKTHRFVGKLSFYFVPFLAILIALTIRQGYLSGVGKMPQPDLLAFQFVPVSAFLMFAWTYTMAMYHRNNRLKHRSYMIVHALGLLWAAFGRMDYSWLGIEDFTTTIMVSYFPSTLLLLGLTGYELSRGKVNRVYLVSLGLFVATFTFYYFGTKGALWQSIAMNIFE